MDINGEYAINSEFDFVSKFWNGYVCVVYKEQLGIIDTNGDIKFFPDYASIDYPSEGFITKLSF
ncbi:hypothetical protein [Paenibacillus sp. YAF4_2]|uniref:hypothetical protein n=1 Tax=Paenibacillus sp. YAF4_2 TaxID=3233085 RepID=UPI003F9ACD5C